MPKLKGEREIKQDIDFFYFYCNVCLGPIISAIVGKLFFIRSYSIKDFRFAVGHEAFFENSEHNKTIVKEFLSFKKRFNEHLIEDVLNV